MSNVTFVEKRLEKFKQKLVAKGLDTAIIMAPENAYYFSNFNQVLNSNPLFIVISTKQAPCLLVYSLRCDHAHKETTIKNIELYGKWGNNVPLAMNYMDALYEIIGGGKIHLGLEMSYVNIELYNKFMSKFDVAQVKDITSDIDDMKNIKDAYEVDCIRKAAVMVDTGVERIIEALAGGLSEAAACSEGQYAMRQVWHSQFPDAEVSGFGTTGEGIIDSINCWCLSNERITYGCDCPIHYVPQSGDLVMPMAWGKINGYHAENERTLYVNSLTPVKQNVLDAVFEARENVFKLVKPGILFEDLFEAAGKAFIKHGFGDMLPGRIGHGIGLCPHEHLSIARGNKMKLVPGMVFTVEPGMMDAAWGGARISDTIVVTETGFEALTKLPDNKLKIVK